MAEPLRVVSTSAPGGGGDREVVARAMRAGLWIWPSFTLLDAYMCFVAYPGAPFGLFLTYRAAVELGLVAVDRAARNPAVATGRLFRWQVLAYGSAAVTIALMAIHLGGIRSPYMHGISIVILVWAVFVPMHWRRALSTMLVSGLAFPVVIGATALVSPSLRADWLRADALVAFGANYVFVLSSAVLGLILSHMVWSARQEARSLGTYRLERLLGKGGMGEVWLATHRLLARQAAIKLVRPEVLGGDAKSRRLALARFEQEARITAGLRSPHTIALYDFGVSEAGAFYYVMELLSGFDAASLVEHFGPMPAGRAVHLLRQVCDSLGEAHARGLVHRDVKPSNIFICRYRRAEDFVKVLDFGLVKPRWPGAPQLTNDDVVSGTPAFMSPEQVLGERETDERSDLYSVGCVAYWLLTGTKVFSGRSAVVTMLMHVHDVPVPPSQRTELPIPPALDALVMSCLEKDPSRRPPSADALADALALVPGADAWTATHARDWWACHDPEGVRAEFRPVAHDQDQVSTT